MDRGKQVNIYMQNKIKLRNAFNYADKTGALYVILVAPNEIANNEIVIKDLRQGEINNRTQIVINIDKFIASL